MYHKMDVKINFKIDYDVSKKGNKIIIVSQIPTEKYPHEKKQSFACDKKYREVIKLKTASDKIFFDKYLEKTCEEVFKIAFEFQDWRFIPFCPITTLIKIESKIPDWVYYKGTEND